VKSLLPHIGADRHRWLYPAGSLYHAGAPLSLGSDWPVSIPDPLAAIQTAVLRINSEAADGYTFAVANVGQPTDYIRGFDGQSFAALHEEERLPIQAAIDAYTIGSARELRLDAQVGSIAVGKRADLIVLDRNVFEVAAAAPDEIGSIRVCRTFFEGKQVYSDREAQEVFEKAPSPTCE
jgi:predicted amidohydrolase YtcJ